MNKTTSDDAAVIINDAIAALEKLKQPQRRVAKAPLKKPAEVIARPAKVPAVKPEKKAPRPRKPKRPTWQTEFKCKTLGGLGGL